MNLTDKYAKYADQNTTSSNGTTRKQVIRRTPATIDMEPILVTILILTIIATVILYAEGM